MLSSKENIDIHMTTQNKQDILSSRKGEPATEGCGNTSPSRSFLTKIRYKIWKHIDKRIIDTGIFRDIHPVRYKIWKHLGKKLHKKGVISEIPHHRVPFVCIMLCYNEQDYLAKAIASVMMQKTSFPYQLLILNNASTDNSLAIAKRFRRQYPEKIRIITHKTNKGWLLNTAFGYEQLRGYRYFCFLDADDYYTADDKFQKAFDFLEKHPDFTGYESNVMIDYGDHQEPFVPANEKNCDFSFADLGKKRIVFMHTSGAVFRNKVFNNGLPDRFAAILDSPFNQSFGADNFRFYSHLEKGRFHFENRIESVYNYKAGGLWGGSDKMRQDLYVLKSNYVFAEYFPNKNEYFIKKAIKLYNQMADGLKIPQTDTMTAEKIIAIEKAVSLITDDMGNEMTALHIS